MTAKILKALAHDKMTSAHEKKHMIKKTEIVLIRDDNIFEENEQCFLSIFLMLGC